MSGHSKWSTIKRKKGAIDAERSKIFQKIAKEIYVAAKGGDKNPDLNASLRTVVEKAKSENMPKDKIQAAIEKAHSANDGETYESVRYEGYGPGGVAIMIDTLTDNRNRTAGDIRSTLTRRGGNLGTDGSVAYLFEKRGLIVLDKKYDEDVLMECALENKALDFTSDETYEILTDPNDFITMKDALTNMGINDFMASEVTYICSNPLEVSDEVREKNINLIEALEDLDDVQNVYSNME